jgi:hypothetical protein
LQRSSEQSSMWSDDCSSGSHNHASFSLASERRADALRMPEQTALPLARDPPAHPPISHNAT